MKIEDEIKQKVFLSEYQKSVINLSYTYFWFKNHFSNFMRPYGITIQQFNVLRILKGQFPNGITTSEIRNRMLDKNCDASRLVDRLECLGLTGKIKNHKDKRLVDVTISALGLELLGKISEKENQIHDKAKNLSLDEAQTLNHLLDKLRG